MPSTREQLYQRFRNGQKPDQEDFKELIDSSFNIRENPREEIPEPVSNVGWYFFQFFPYPLYRLGFGASYRKYREFQVLTGKTIAVGSSGDVSMTAVPSFAGGMNIPIPKGVTYINQIRIKGEFSCSLNDGESAYFRFYLKTIPIKSIQLTPSQINNPISGRHPVDDLINVNAPIINQGDTLSIFIYAEPRSSSLGTSFKNRMSIEMIGIEFI